jgi:hypothetical protein
MRRKPRPCPGRNWEGSLLSVDYKAICVRAGADAIGGAGLRARYRPRGSLPLRIGMVAEAFLPLLYLVAFHSLRDTGNETMAIDQ